MDRKRYPAETSDYESDPGTMQYHDSHIDESEPYTSLHETICSGDTDIIEFGAGSAAEGNARMGTQVGGIRSPEAGTFKLRGW